MVPLRSMYPNTGRMTLRYQMPRIDVSPADFDIDAALTEVLGNDTTTSQVARSEAFEGETETGKGGQAR